MTNSFVRSQVFGVLLSPASKLDAPRLRADLAASGATLLTESSGRMILAVWGVDEPNRHIDPDGISAILVGSPRFKGRTPDTRLPAADLAALFRRTGAQLLDNVAGNFFLALLDHEQERVVIAIDRLGVESGFYRPYADGSLAFSTDLALLREYVGSDLTWSNQAIYEYTYFHVVPSPLTIYTGAYKLPPSHLLQHSRDEHSVVRYWAPNYADTSAGLSELGDGLKRALRGSVVRCLEEAHGKAGGFLSGGLDSSTICGMMAEEMSDSVTAVSVGFDQSGYDEVDYARVAARYFGLDHCIHYITPDEVADSILRIANDYPEPFGNSSVVPTYVCALTARENGISTLLAGDGGDELFGGNSRYVRQQIFELYWRLPAGVRAHLMEPMFAGTPRSWQVGPLRKLHRYVTQATVPLPHRLHTENILETNRPSSVFTDNFLADVDLSHPLTVMKEEYFAAGENSTALDRMLLFDWRFTLADNDIRKVSRMCDLAGVAVRYPFLDDEVLDMSLRVPSNIKIRRFQLRYFYKQSLKDFLPREVIGKSKHGFGLPFGEWLLGSKRLQEMVYDSLTDLGRWDMFKRSFIDALIDDHRSTHAAYYGDEVWVLAMLAWWFDRHSRSAVAPAQAGST